ncbi:hypothetical protein C8E97_3386 [Saccharothrix australiensis]|uniref:Uncharacterized protein n=1 Tax=Saccharothrix australiensis TaxID=2072 RepID=A0A495W4L6_9PSEU|nr:hypothetical protein C8E97_3386 [Saccharothrix australiensis]
MRPLGATPAGRPVRRSPAVLAPDRSPTASSPFDRSADNRGHFSGTQVNSVPPGAGRRDDVAARRASADDNSGGRGPARPKIRCAESRARRADGIPVRGPPNRDAVDFRFGRGSFRGRPKPARPRSAPTATGNSTLHRPYAINAPTGRTRAGRPAPQWADQRGLADNGPEPSALPNRARCRSESRTPRGRSRVRRFRANGGRCASVTRTTRARPALSALWVAQPTPGRGFLAALARRFPRARPSGVQMGFRGRTNTCHPNDLPAPFPNHLE